MRVLPDLYNTIFCDYKRNNHTNIIDLCDSET